MANRKIQDFAVEQDNCGDFDFVIDLENKDFESVEGMETAVDFQLFTNQRVSKEEVAVPLARQGWIGDMQTREEGFQVGSLIFLKNQARDTFLDNNETAAYAKDSLEYFVSIGASKEISARVVGKNIEGVITNDDNTISRYNRLWRGTQSVKKDETPKQKTFISMLLSSDNKPLITSDDLYITVFSKL